MSQSLRIGIARLILPVLCVAEPTMAQNKNSDPSFNGTLTREVCQVITFAACGDGFCADLNPGSGGFNSSIGSVAFDFSDRTVRKMPNMNVISPMEIVDVSEAGLNKPLWVKFKFQNEHLINGVDGPITAIVALIPQANHPGGYVKKFGLVAAPAARNQGAYGIPGMNTFIFGGNCNRLG